MKSAGSEVIKRKGATYYAIASVIAKASEVVLKDQRSVLNVSSLMEGRFDLYDVCLSMPSIVGRSGVENIIVSELSDDESEKLNASAEAIKKVIHNLL